MHLAAVSSRSFPLRHLPSRPPFSAQQAALREGMDKVRDLVFAGG
jgi:hypothetical protein